MPTRPDRQWPDVPEPDQHHENDRGHERADVQSAAQCADCDHDFRAEPKGQDRQCRCYEDGADLVDDWGILTREGKPVKGSRRLQKDDRQRHHS